MIFSLSLQYITNKQHLKLDTYMSTSLSLGLLIFHQKKKKKVGGEVIYNTHSPNPRDSDLFSLKLGLGVGIFENTPQ